MNEEKQKLLHEARKELQDKETDGCTFKPKLCDYSREIYYDENVGTHDVDLQPVRHINEYLEHKENQPF